MNFTTGPSFHVPTRPQPTEVPPRPDPIQPIRSQA